MVASSSASRPSAVSTAEQPDRLEAALGAVAPAQARLDASGLSCRGRTIDGATAGGIGDVSHTFRGSVRRMCSASTLSIRVATNSTRPSANADSVLALSNS